MAAKVDKNLSPELVTAIAGLLKAEMEREDATLLDKLRVIDRALALEKIKQKINDDEWGSAFAPEDSEEGNA